MSFLTFGSQGRDYNLHHPPTIEEVPRRQMSGALYSWVMLDDVQNLYN